MTDLGNAVNAKWVGPAGHQLWDGTLLQPGDIVLGVGYDEATGNPYWEIVDKLPRNAAPVSDTSRNRTDISDTLVDEPPAPEPEPAPTPPAKGAES